MFSWLSMVTHGYYFMVGHVFLFHTPGQKFNYNHSAMKTWLTIITIIVITSFLIVNHSLLKNEYNDRPLL